MNKARNRFILLTELSIVLLLSLLLTVINVVNFTMAADDADFLTEHIAQRHGTLDKSQTEPKSSKPSEAPPVPSQGSTTSSGAASDTQTSGGGTDSSNTARSNKPFRLDNGRYASMGPDSPEMNSSLRYFTYSFNKDGEAKVVDFRMSSVTEEEAQTWAESLLNSTTGWTNVTYRYRVYEDGKKTYVTVIDQGRELWPCYRTLIISVVGGLLFILLSFLLAQFIGRRLFKPLEEADRKQKLFIAKLENEFKMPLTVINADTEILERQNGTNEQTQSINKQVKRMTRLVKDLGALSVFEETESSTKTNLSDLMTSMLENNREPFAAHKVTLAHTIEPDITVNINDEAVKTLIGELIDNALKFSVSQASFTLQRHHDRIKLVQSNDTTLPNGSCDQIFDRFTMLENAAGTNGSGLGLAHVKEIVQSCNGRMSAAVKDGIITITLDL